jgi:hypothetical protein
MRTSPQVSNKWFLPCFLGGALLLSGCQSVGPESIQEGRPQYNEAIQATTGDQLLTNIARVYLNETPLSLEVSQIVAGTNATGSLGGSVSGLGIGKKGGPFRAGSLTYGALMPMLSYSEQPSVTYQPISGAALVQEFTKPVPVSLITDLNGSSWPILSILEMVTTKITDRQDDYGAALNAIAALDNLNAIDLASVNSSGSGEAAAKPPPAGQSNSQPDSDPNTLVLYFIPPTSCVEKQLALGEWRLLLNIYDITPTALVVRKAAVPDASKDRIACPGTLDNDIAKTIGVIELNTTSRRSTGSPKTVAALQQARRRLTTYSGYGILKSVSESFYTPAEIIQVITPDRFAKIKSEPWNKTGEQWYTLLKEDICYPSSTETSRCLNLSLDPDKINDYVDGIIQAFRPSAERPELYTANGDPTTEDNLNQRRRLILIEVSHSAPEDPFRMIVRNGVYYYIAGDDYISQKNFALLQLVISVQAVAQTPPPQQSISVGAH